MAKTFDALPEALVETLKKEVIVSLITVNEHNNPEVSAVSWVLSSEDGKKIGIAVGHKGSSMSNVQQNPNVTLGFFADESYYSVKGTGTVSEIIEKTMKYRVITVDVKEVEDVIFYGGKVTQQPAYEKTYDAQLAEKLDNEVHEILTEALK
ncbi:pyridoxamine 5'-phosphate oxidase family protein [Bacillus pinisoli]|uniref:pyridoxamine 5'-phosphate oxidase family protein n=1 Tax=Bacillus pinisoli TaxID=2901866 RepID=UPI001FF5344C|nr:pyridoxamine 5'-phosphate oxidase family protein [Bacillus pinisoli]